MNFGMSGFAGAAVRRPGANIPLAAANSVKKLDAALGYGDKAAAQILNFLGN